MLVFLPPATPVAAFTPPELFVRYSGELTEPQGDWIPLASAPALDWLDSYEVGYRLQESGAAHELQSVALTVNAVPDGQPTQPFNMPPYGPYCVNRAGTVGDIQPASPPLQFEGDGTYTVTVTVGASTGDSTSCLSGAATTASFRVTMQPAPVIVGTPLAVRAKPLPPGAFAGVRLDRPPPGGTGELQCAMGSLSVDGSEIAERDFKQPGAWTCMARGESDGIDDAMNTASYFTPWSAPRAVDVHADFRRSQGRASRIKSSRPRLTFTAEFGALAAGGRGTLSLARFTRCSAKHPVLASYRATFDAKGRAAFTIRRPKRGGYYRGTLKFSGTRWLNAGADPNPVGLVKGPAGFGFTTLPRC